MTSDPRFYNLESDLPAGAFGSVCAATAVTTEGTPAGTALLEYLYVLTRGQPRLFLTSEEMPLTGPLSEATAAELHEEGGTRLKRALEDRLEARASELAKPDMALTPLDLKHTEARPLMGAAMRGEWTDEIRTLAATVKTPAPAPLLLCSGAWRHSARELSLGCLGSPPVRRYRCKDRGRTNSACTALHGCAR